MQARYMASGNTPEQLIDTGMPEIAVIGRSNTGKSSLLGAIMGKPDLVRVSRTPGRTRALNMFIWEERIALVDLPGYGYAKISKKDRTQLAQMIQSYLMRRTGLVGVLHLLDLRREEPSEEDVQISHWVRERQIPLLPIFTKADLIPKPRMLHQQRCIEKALGVPLGSGLLSSSHTGMGLHDIAVQMRMIAQGKA